MVNMLVIEDNILQGKELINIISKELELKKKKLI